MITFTNYDTQKLAKASFMSLLAKYGEEKSNLFLNMLLTKYLTKQMTELSLEDYNITKQDIKSLVSYIKTIK